MKKYAVSQSLTDIIEDFDQSMINLTANPVFSWRVNTDYYTSFPNSFVGKVPNKVGDSTILQTQIFDFNQ